ncbi:unnamed protein product, partial [Adineta steineri]
ARTNYSPSDYPHSDKPLDEIDEKYTRVPPNMTQYRPNIPDHITDDLSQLTNPIGVSLINPPFSHLSHQNPYSNSNNNKKDDDHLFLHPSCIGDNHRRVQDTYTMPSNNSNNIQQQMSS